MTTEIVSVVELCLCGDNDDLCCAIFSHKIPAARRAARQLKHERRDSFCRKHVIDDAASAIFDRAGHPLACPTESRVERAMSALGQKQTYAAHKPMSAKCQ